MNAVKSLHGIPTAIGSKATSTIIPPHQFPLEGTNGLFGNSLFVPVLKNIRFSKMSSRLLPLLDLSPEGWNSYNLPPSFFSLVR